MTRTPPKLLSTAEVGERLGLSRRRVQALIQDGKLPAITVGGTSVVEESAVAKYKPTPVGRPKQRRKRTPVATAPAQGEQS